MYDLRLDPRSEVVAVYCEMGNSECGSGGWTLAMKIDGAKVRFFLDSATFLLLHFLLVYKERFFSVFNFRILLLTIPLFGVTKKVITLKGERLGLTKPKPSCRPTGKRPLPRFVLE